MESSRALVALLCSLASTLGSTLALAEPKAHLLRVDPRAAFVEGGPVLTTVLDVSQSRSVGDVISGCRALHGNALFRCMSEALEKPRALYTPLAFPAHSALFTVAVNGEAIPARLVSDASWGDSTQQAGVGTAWLILIDVDRSMGPGLADAKQLAHTLLANLAPHDIVNVMLFDAQQVVKDSKWLPAEQRAALDSLVSGSELSSEASPKSRSLLTIIKSGATDGFNALSYVGAELQVPLHQALVVLSSGFGGMDPGTTGPGAIELEHYFSDGRFPEDSATLPKAPTPVVSVWYPPTTGTAFVGQNALDFMQNLANPALGGFFTVMPRRQSNHSAAIVASVRERFAQMHVVKWRVPCVAPSSTQTFKLDFNDVTPPLTGDHGFLDAPIGLDPASLPLDVDLAQTGSQPSALVPGGALEVYGSFCWGSDKSRPEIYFLPAGQALLDASDAAKQELGRLMATGLKGQALQASDRSVRFQVPDSSRLVWGSGEQRSMRFVVYDNQARRSSGVTAGSVLQVKASLPPPRAAAPVPPPVALERAAPRRSPRSWLAVGGVGAVAELPRAAPGALLETGLALDERWQLVAGAMYLATERAESQGERARFSATYAWLGPGPRWDLTPRLAVDAELGFLAGWLHGAPENLQPLSVTDTFSYGLRVASDARLALAGRFGLGLGLGGLLLARTTQFKIQGAPIWQQPSVGGDAQLLAIWDGL